MEKNVIFGAKPVDLYWIWVIEQVKGYVMFLLERFIDIKRVKITIFDLTLFFVRWVPKNGKKTAFF